MLFSLSFHECFLYRLLTSLRGGSWLASHIISGFRFVFTLTSFRHDSWTSPLSTSCAPEALRAKIPFKKQFVSKLPPSVCPISEAPPHNSFCIRIYLSAPDKLFHSTAAPGHSVLMQICSTFPISESPWLHVQLVNSVGWKDQVTIKHSLKTTHRKSKRKRDGFILVMETFIIQKWEFISSNKQEWQVDHKLHHSYYQHWDSSPTSLG